MPGSASFLKFLYSLSSPSKTAFDYEILTIFPTSLVSIFPKFPLFWCQGFQILPQKLCQYFQNEHYFGVNIPMFSLKWTYWRQIGDNFGNIDIISVAEFGIADTKRVEILEILTPFLWQNLETLTSKVWKFWKNWHQNSGKYREDFSFNKSLRRVRKWIQKF